MQSHLNFWPKVHICCLPINLLTWFDSNFLVHRSIPARYSWGLPGRYVFAQNTYKPPRLLARPFWGKGWGQYRRCWSWKWESNNSRYNVLIITRAREAGLKFLELCRQRIHIYVCYRCARLSLQICTQCTLWNLLHTGGRCRKVMMSSRLTFTFASHFIRSASDGLSAESTSSAE